MAPTTRATTTSPSPPSTPREPSRLPVLEVLGVIATFRQNVERFKLYRASLSVIRFLLVLNLTYTVLGVAFLIMAFAKDLTPEFSNDQRSQFGRIGKQDFAPFEQSTKIDKLKKTLATSCHAYHFLII